MKSAHPMRSDDLVSDIVEPVCMLSGLLHDIAKAGSRFAGKLAASVEESSGAMADPIRHEWLSAWLARHLLSRDAVLIDSRSLVAVWRDMADQCEEEGGPGDEESLPIPSPMRRPIDAALWIICTHHRVFGGSLDSPLTGSEHMTRSPKYEVCSLADESAFVPGHAPEDAKRWSEWFDELNEIVARLGKDIEMDPPFLEGVMLVCRAALILADHAVSARVFPGKREDGILYANTKKCAKRKSKKGPSRFLDQPLSWHLLEVGGQARANARMFLDDDLPCVDRALVRAILDKRTETERFRWQDEASDAVSGANGLILNVASTGAGKTLANLKMAFSMRPDAVRLAVAFNLRTLTTQTFKAFGKHVSAIDPAAFGRDFACLLGERGIPAPDAERVDEDSADDVYRVDLEGAERLALPEWLKRMMADQPDEKLAKLIASPVLVSTMDWIVAAGEPGEQARHAKALLRVRGSDLILDEVDSYDVQATVAVMRVVQTAAMFGRNVICSSATLMPPLVRGLCAAYAAGRRVHDAMFGAKEWRLILVSDRFNPKPHPQINPDAEAAETFYRDTMSKMASSPTPTKNLPIRLVRRYFIAPVSSKNEFHEVIERESLRLHDANAFVPPGLDCRLSIGVVRVAHVDPCADVAEHLRSSGKFFVTAYHAREIEEYRAWKEGWLDRILFRGDDEWVGHLLKICPWLIGRREDARLVVVATPLEEIGRDHDFDWSVVEPSSMHSMIQLAGRTLRHRLFSLRVGSFNVCLLSRNLKDLSGEKYVFRCPGLETEGEEGESTHPSHDLLELMRPEEGGEPDYRMDAGLVFDSKRKTLFARYDEEAVRRQIGRALPVIERNAGKEIHFMAKAFQKDFPLRDGDNSRVYYIDRDKREFFIDDECKIRGGGLAWNPDPSIGIWLSRDAWLRERDSDALLRFRTDKQVSRINVSWNRVEVFS